MTTLHNEIIIHAPLEKIWNVLATPDLLDKYDPTVKKSALIARSQNNLGLKRRVEMADGKNWFEEQITVFKPYDALTFELVACSFPVTRLKHSYSFQKIGNDTKVNQVMEYTVKFGVVGKLLDLLMIRRQSDQGIKKFFGGLKKYVESK